MAYGTTAGVTLLLGGVDTTTYTTTNMTAAIVMSDVWVDKINPSASDAIKTQASNEIAANIMKSGRANKKLKGLSSDGGTQGRPGVGGNIYPDFVTPSIITLLRESERAPKFSHRQPDVTGSV